MRQSELGFKTRREAPKDEVAKNAQLLIRAGFVHKELAGVYSLLPLGRLTLEKINSLIRREMNGLGGVEVSLSSLQNPALWQATGRWESEAVDVWFKTQLKTGSEVGLGFTHEEPLTNLLTGHIQSYRDLPRAIYQIQTKFRNELRSKSGLIRCREFLMKDLYSFHATDKAHEEFYYQMQAAYQRILAELGLGAITYLTFASGGAFSKYSHEFQTISPAGEDSIYVSAERKIAVNAEVLNPEVLEELGLNKDELQPQTGIEVGNIFHLGTRFSEALGLIFKTETGETRPVIMGSYGLGPTRLLGTVAEVLADEHGLVWPQAIAPFTVHVVSLSGGAKADAILAAAASSYQQLEQAGISVVWYHREVSAGEKFADSDLLGLPYRLVIGEKGLAAGAWEVKNRQTGEVKNLTIEAFIQFLHD